MSSFLRFGRLLLFTLLLGPLAASAQTAAPETLAPVKLRGYGELSGNWRTLDHGSFLQIICESEDKARITQAKYISDLHELPGVQPTTVPGPQGPMAAWSFGPEVFLAARDGRNVDVLTADSTAALAKLAPTVLPAAALHFKPEVDVPMFLDRWDKYSFRFYDSPLSTPDGKNLATYDKNTEFDWSVKNQTGFQLWDPVYEFDTAQGVTSKLTMQWTADTARTCKLPLGINLSTNDQTWLEDWYPTEMAQHMPEFLGSYYNGAMQSYDGTRFLSWDSTIGEDMELATLQQDVKHFAPDENVTSWLEPHGEMGHADSDFLMDYGPVADQAFRLWLQRKYGSVDAVSRRWTGKPGGFASWDDVHVPEMASFCGWGPDALDLTGTWKVDYLNIPVPGNEPIAYPTDTFAATYDDSSWPDVTAPGDAHAMFLPQGKPAIFRRTFNVDAAWLKAHPRVWLYVFDLNGSFEKEIIATLNGKEIGRSKVPFASQHRGWYEATAALRAGANTLALALPDGFLAYRVYLSGTEPRVYPDLGEEMNARWADFADWAAWSRYQKVQRGMEMIRQVDPDRGILLMSPGPYFGGEQPLAKKYGGDFHDTGGMGGWWNTFLPELANGIGMPMSVEPSQPAHNVDELHGGYGRWSTEGIQAVDYFLTLGDIFWHDDIRADFESNLKLWKLIGKYHVAPPQYATLYSGRNATLLSFPWNNPDKNVIVPSGYVTWGWHDANYPGTAGVCEAEFLSGAVDKYKVIFDSNSSILDPDMIDAIGRYVKQGGIFVTYVQTGRDSSTQPNSWPISQLTGYSVTSIDPYPAGNDLESGGGYDLAPGQTLFAPDKWDVHLAGGSGLHLKKVAPDCQDLLVWKDGTIAAGMRPLGKGYIFDFGTKTDSVGWGDSRTTTELFDAVLDFAKIPRDPIQLGSVTLAPSVTSHDANTNGFVYRHFLSNNGLYDVFSVWNSNANPLDAEIDFPADGPASAIVVKTGDPMPLVKNAAGLPALKISLAPNESASYLTPRAHLENAAREWFDLQREWWKGATPPPPNRLPSLAEIHRQTLPLDEDWTCKRLTEHDDAATLAAPGLDDSDWQKSALKALLVALPAPNTPGNTLLFRKKFTVPANWTKGPVVLYMTYTEGTTFIDSASIYLDGTLVQPPTGAVINAGFNGAFKPGSTHLLAVEIPSKSCIVGNVGGAWLYYRPDPSEEMPVAGTWESSLDGLRFDGKTTIPGPWDTDMARGVVNIPARHAKQTVLLHFEMTGRMTGAIVNGKLISQSHVSNCPSFDLNITPWVKFGQDNRIELVAGGRSQANIGKLALDFYDPGTYP